MAVEEEGEGEKDAIITDQQNAKLSHKKWRRLLQKEKRRVKRQQLAEKRKQLEEQEKWRLENDSLYRAKLEAKERAAEKRRLQEEEDSKKQEKLWLEREAQAQIAFTKIKEREEKKEQERIEQERRIKEEWEEEQRLKKEKEEKKKQEIQEKENAVFKELEKPAEQTSTSESQWHNPLAPAASSQHNYGTEQDGVNCSFYLKTGACRFGERCSRVHPRIPSSVTLLIPHMYQDIRLSQTMLDEADHDTGLEFDDEESYESYKNFFDDVLPEFEKAGKVVQFKVCCNHEPHLRGNVYVQFLSEEECAQAFAAFNGRWYAGKQLSCEYSPVTKWRSAICGFFTRNQCPRGKNCNFLHVYRNPGNAFRNMDRDDMSPGRTPYSERGSERSMRDWRRESRDREGSERDRRGTSEHRRYRDYERTREYRYSRDHEHDNRERDNRERNRDSRDRDHIRRHDRDSHKRDRKRNRERDNDFSASGDDRDRLHGNHKDSKQDRFGRDIDHSMVNEDKNSNKRNRCDGADDEEALHYGRDKRKISRDRSSSSDQENIRKTSSNVEDDASSEKGRHRKKKHSHKHHKKSKKKHKHKKRSSSDSDG